MRSHSTVTEPPVSVGVSYANTPWTSAGGRSSVGVREMAVTDVSSLFCVSTAVTATQWAELERPVMVFQSTVDQSWRLIEETSSRSP